MLTCFEFRIMDMGPKSLRRCSTNLPFRTRLPPDWFPDFGLKGKSTSFNCFLKFQRTKIESQRFVIKGLVFKSYINANFNRVFHRLAESSALLHQILR